MLLLILSVFLFTLTSYAKYFLCSKKDCCFFNIVTSIYPSPENQFSILFHHHYICLPGILKLSIGILLSSGMTEHKINANLPDHWIDYWTSQFWSLPRQDNFEPVS